MKQKEYISNPFSLDFGAKPTLYISRADEEEKILKSFMSDIPSSHLFLIIGARGMGKTALMTSVTGKIKDDSSWIHIDVDSESNILQSLYYHLNNIAATSLSKIDVTLKLPVLSINFKWNDNEGDIRYELDKLLQIFKKNGRKILITIDEVVNSTEMRAFAAYYQHCIREEFPVFVLMTGLFKNVRALQNNRSLTFLRRATKITLGPLSEIRIAREFEKVLNLPEESAVSLARLTEGYSYAFQILGHLIFDSPDKTFSDEIYKDFKNELFDNSYEKIWEELSEKEKEVLKVISEYKDGVAVSTVKQQLNMDSNNFSTYRDSLQKSGLIEMSSYGVVKICLPLLDEYVIHFTF